jgi:hypothetical protein
MTGDLKDGWRLFQDFETQVEEDLFNERPMTAMGAKNEEYQGPQRDVANL